MSKILTLIFFLFLIYSCEKEIDDSNITNKFKVLTFPWDVGETYGDQIFERKFRFKGDSLLLENWEFKCINDYLAMGIPVSSNRIKTTFRLTTDSIFYGDCKFRYTVNTDSLVLWNMDKPQRVYYSKRKIRTYKLYWE